MFDVLNSGDGDLLFALSVYYPQVTSFAFALEDTRNIASLNLKLVIRFLSFPFFLDLKVLYMLNA